LTECQKCPNLVKSRTSIVQGRGPHDADLLFVGEAPGREEDARNKAFIGKAGHVLAVLLQEAGIDPSSVYLLNSCFCRPPGNRTPKVDELLNCRPNVIDRIERVQPKVIVSLGGPALHTLYRNMPISDVAGQTLIQEDTGIPLVPTFHPAFVMRQWSMTPVVISHMQKAARLAEHGLGDRSMGDYAPILSLSDLRDLRDYLTGPQVERFAFDTETTGLDWMRDELLCISFSPEVGIGYVVPIIHDGGKPFWADKEWPEVICLLREIFASDKPKEGQNAHFDIRFLERRADEEHVKAVTAFGLHVENLDQDTLFLSRALQESVPHSLTALTAFWTDLPYYEEEVQILSKRKRRMIDVPDYTLWHYGGADADVVRRITPQLQKLVTEQGSAWLLDNITTPMVRAAWEMERRGVLVDTELFAKLCTHYEEAIKKAEAQLYEVAGYELKYKGTAALQHFLFDVLGLPIPNERTEGAKGCKECAKEHPCISHVATGKKVLEQLYAEHKHPAIPIILDLKKMNKFYSTYLGGGEGGYGRYIQSDNRIHAHVKVSHAATGRHAYEEPNLQNMPKSVEVPELGLKDALRQCFIATSGHVLMNADWSQVEVWVLAYQTGDETLMKLLLGGEDVHTYVARKIGELDVSPLFPHVGVDLDDQEWRQEYEELRRKAKVFTFGISYGLTDEGAAARLGCDAHEASILLKTYTTDILPSLPAYFDKVEEQILTEHCLPNKFGRVRHFPEVPVLQVLNYRHDLQSIIRQGYNFPIQSGAHDLHSRAHVVTEAAAELRGRARIILEVHDSLVFEAKAPDHDYVVETAWLIKNLWERVAKETVLQDGTKLGWECPVEISWGPSLGETHWVLTSNGNLVKLEKEVQ